MTKILVVDDDTTVRKICGGLLKRKGYKVLLSSGGEESLKILKESSIDIIILDLVMPGVTGLEVLKRIRELSKKVFVIILTGIEITKDIEKLADESTCILSKENGMRPLLTKIDEMTRK